MYNKKEVGQDRLVNAYASKVLFRGIPIIIDFGTAITFDFLSKRGEYLGGFISPGISLSYQALSRCALLPNEVKINPKKTQSIPKNTQGSINKGIIEGTSLLVNTWIKSYTQILKSTPTPIAIITGGEAKYVLKRLTFSCIYEPQLILKGLLLLTQKLS
jgi:type III pantothenate kinase